MDWVADNGTGMMAARLNEAMRMAPGATTTRWILASLASG